MQAGIRGIKVHPDYVGMQISDPRFDVIFSLAEERGMFVVTHCGSDPVSPDRIHATAAELLAIVRRHPKLTFIAAHMGGPDQLDDVTELLAGSAIWLDTSLCSNREGERDKLIALLKNHDPDRLLFGTDTPWTDPKAEVAFLENAGLSADTLDKIFYRNAAKLLNL